jgi:hypothetical protein
MESWKRMEGKAFTRDIAELEWGHDKGVGEEGQPPGRDRPSNQSRRRISYRAAYGSIEEMSCESTITVRSTPWSTTRPTVPGHVCPAEETAAEIIPVEGPVQLHFIEPGGNKQPTGSTHKTITCSARRPIEPGPDDLCRGREDGFPGRKRNGSQRRSARCLACRPPTRRPETRSGRAWTSRQAVVDPDDATSSMGVAASRTWGGGTGSGTGTRTGRRLVLD